MAPVHHVIGLALLAKSDDMAKSTDDRNLLFGILALQMDFVTREQLVAAMNAWVLAKEKPLGQILAEHGALAADRRALLEALVAEHLKLHGNDPEKSLAAVSSAGAIKDALGQINDPGLQASLRTMPTVAAPDPYVTVAQSVGAATSSGSRFRIVRPHARGGLGEVFVAQDEELHREVAVKQIQMRHADEPESRIRFVQEAEITGGLEHPGIVPVYGLGTYADGRPYYAMRFIRGDSLKDAIERYHGAAGKGAARPSEASNCDRCWADSSTSATRSNMPTAAACCTAISSRATSCSANTAKRWSSIGAWPSRSIGRMSPSGSVNRRCGHRR